MKPSSVSAAISCAFSTAPFMPFAGSVSTRVAPNALRRTRRSRDMDAGMVSTSLYDLAAAMNARPMPVLPLVGSIRVVFPAVIEPLSSASAIMLYPILSFTLQQGSIISSLAHTSATHPSVILFRYTIGVCPMSCVTLSAMFICLSGAATALQVRARRETAPARRDVTPMRTAEGTAFFLRVLRGDTPTFFEEMLVLGALMHFAGTEIEATDDAIFLGYFELLKSFCTKSKSAWASI
mmetsp:Transcript_8011/g.13893  ORF Transcript_8011/g.13893 Transcript_8011/m.13893 type:complete len:237 (-) Transcript_8011:2-712(-)